MFNYNRTKKGLIARIYQNQRTSSFRRRHSLPEYSAKELREFALSSEEYHILFNKWEESGYLKDEAPSFDRIDDDKPYAFDNFNGWVSWKENNERASLMMRNGETRNGGKKRVSVVRIKPHSKEEQVYISIHEAARKNNMKSSARISDVLDREQRTAGGFIWKKFDN